KLRGSGVATRELLESTMKLAAFSKVEGIEDVFGTYAEVLTGGFDEFTKADTKIQAALMRFAQGNEKLMSEIMAGRGLLPENLKPIFEGMKIDYNQVFGIDLLKADLSKIDSDRMRVMEIMADQIYGKKLGDIQKELK